MRTIIDRYMVREAIGPFILAMTVITFVIIMQLVMKKLDLLVGHGVDLWVVIRVVTYMLASTISLTVPMSALVAMVIGFGRLSRDFEIIALKANGFSLYQLLYPVLTLGVFLTIGMIMFNHFVLPEANYSLKELLSNIALKRPTIELRENVFLDNFEGYRILLGQVNPESSEIADVTIIEDKTLNKPASTIVADRGKVAFMDEGQTLKIDLYDGEIHQVSEQNPKGYERMVFKEYTIYFKELGTDLTETKRAFRGDREMNVAMLKAAIDEAVLDAGDLNIEITEAQARFDELNAAYKVQSDSFEVTEDQLNLKKDLEIAENRIGTLKHAHERKIQSINRFRVELHKKFSIPCAIIAFILIGMPVGIQTRSGGTVIGASISMVFFYMYYFFLIGGEDLADRGIVRAWIAMWTPNIVLTITGALLLFATAQERKFLQFRLPPKLKQFLNMEQKT